MAAGHALGDLCARQRHCLPFRSQQPLELAVRYALVLYTCTLLLLDRGCHASASQELRKTKYSRLTAVFAALSCFQQAHGSAALPMRCRTHIITCVLAHISSRAYPTHTLHTFRPAQSLNSYHSTLFLATHTIHTNLFCSQAFNDHAIYSNKPVVLVYLTALCCCSICMRYTRYRVGCHKRILRV